jgi:hypothetical protein
MARMIPKTENPIRELSFQAIRWFPASDENTVVCTMKMLCETNQCIQMQTAISGTEYRNGIDSMYEDRCIPWGEDTRKGFFSLT